MNDTINLTKRVVSKEEFNKVVNTKFTTYTSEYVNNPLEDDVLTIQQFFNEYTRLYFEIPILGKTNSHEFLYKKSGELFTLPQQTIQISLLLEEIENLRLELLQVNRELGELRS